jgi:hypothetical protein
MTKVWIGIAFAAALAGCGSKKEPGGGGGDGSGTAAASGSAVAPGPATCPPGNAVKDGACVPVITAEKVDVVVAEKTRIDEAAALLDKVDAISAPIELLGGLRQTEQWKQLVTATPKLAVVDQIVILLDDAVKRVRQIKEDLAGASTRLGNIKGELDKVLQSTGAAQQLADLRARVSTELRGALEPIAIDVSAAVEQVLGPLIVQLDDTADIVIGACAMAKLSGGGDKLKELCAQAKDVFPRALQFLEDAKAKPALLVTSVTVNLETALDQLIDEGTKAALDAAQTKVNEVLKLPAAGSAGSGSGTAAGSGSAAP